MDRWIILEPQVVRRANNLLFAPLANTLSIRTVSIRGFVALGPPVRTHVTFTCTGRTRRELCGGWEAALGLKLLLDETASTEAG
jgi:hypothetical protein